MSEKEYPQDGFQNRYALILANYKYQDTSLQQLVAPARDARALARILGDPAIGGFSVEQMLINKPSHLVSQAIEGFFSNRKPDDLLLLYFSGHGIKDDDGRLYLAVANTYRNLLRSTSISSALINDIMRRSRSRRQLLLLDCCYSGAFARGAEVKSASGVGSPMGTNEQFEGRGRVVLTASDALQYAFEGDEVKGTGAASVFTHAVVQGLENGEADKDRDGWVSLDELYDYVFDRVSELSPQQVPEKWDFGVQGGIVIARNPKSAAASDRTGYAPDAPARQRVRQAPASEPESGLYITRMFAENVGDYGLRQTVWVAARGPLQYVLDSAHILKINDGGAGPLAAVAVPPDAEYQFPYNDSSDYIAPLNPALSIGPDTRRVASFVFSTAPDKPIYFFGPLKIWIQYQISDGQSGKILLANPSESGVKLARLVGADVFVNMDTRVDEVVSPNGLMRGMDGEGPPLRYARVSLPDEYMLYGLDRQGLLRMREKYHQIIEQRTSLHRILNQSNHLAVLAEWLADGNPMGADLLGGIASPKSDRYLDKILDEHPLDGNGLFGLCVRHLVKADGKLAMHVLQHRDEFLSNENALKHVVLALAMNPVGEWLQVVNLLKKDDFFMNSAKVMRLLVEDLSPQQLHQYWNASLGPMDAVLYLRGSMNQWKASATAGKFVYGRDGTYSLQVTLVPGAYEFKIADENWRYDTNLGANSRGQSILLDQAFPLAVRDLSQNIGLEIQEAGNYQFLLDVRDYSNITVTVSAIRQ